MSDQYSALLATLSQPITIPHESDNNDSMNALRTSRNDVAAALKDSFPPITTVEDLTHTDNNENEIELPVNMLHESAPSRKDRFCANFPICSRLAKECGGWKSAHCLHLKNNEITLPDPQTLMQLKLQHKRNVDRENKREKRRRI